MRVEVREGASSSGASSKGACEPVGSTSWDTSRACSTSKACASTPKQSFELLVVGLNLGELLRREATSSTSALHILEEDLKLAPDEVEALLVEGFHLGLELLVLFAESVDISWLSCLSSQKPANELVHPMLMLG